ncbi:glycosidase [Lewinella marina]|uniref:Alpha-amlyase n=1 Tax=Neolewinella marina TaxID=438751 RepID=A0A2G0CGR5_9BACT|nr:glycoside hydrolase family 13 protein [Neolewinella marina]NJB86366.1 glycosidase [Neolewinella marina]PHK99166.1 alpha-amlyase [Neolewinella marina]
MPLRPILTFCLLAAFLPLLAQTYRVEPPNWWAGMQDTSLQLLIYGADAGSLELSVSGQGVVLLGTHRADSPNYLFADLSIRPEATAGTVQLTFSRGGQTVATQDYELRPRERSPEAVQGFDASDVIYLITPDRFANGDPSNDVVDTLRETALDRTQGFARHGGDLQGITDHLDYIDSMGFTAIWPSPVLENDMPAWSYHGYAITDYYAVDPRFGTLADYRALADAARARGIKLIMDQVVNHSGSGHWWMDDLPFGNWLNFQDAPQITNHRRSIHQDPYAARVDAERMVGGWFVSTMPDLNQRNPFLARYLIQNSLWWIETLGLGGVRQDTYPYPDANFLTDWTCRIMQEYPNFSIVGEEWSYNPATVAYWQRGKDNPDGYISCLPSVMDFPLQASLISALKNDEGWDSGLIKLYEALANDFQYAEPRDIMVFAENHDMDRLATQLGGDVDHVKMALTYLLTVRGIPQLYYGSEVLLDNDEAPGDHGIIRSDMPGGWAGDAVNAFTGAGLSPGQREVQTHLRQLLQWRREHPVIATGQTLHFAPENGTYVYGRYNATERVVVVLNKNAEEVTLDPARYQELLKGVTTATGLDGKVVDLSRGLAVPSKSAVVFVLQ